MCLFKVASMQAAEHSHLKLKGEMNDHTFFGDSIADRCGTTLMSFVRYVTFATQEFVRELSKRKVTCGKCVQPGHMRTSRDCPLHENRRVQLWELFPSDESCSYIDKLDMALVKKWGCGVQYKSHACVPAQSVSQ